MLPLVFLIQFMFPFQGSLRNNLNVCLYPSFPTSHIENDIEELLLYTPDSWFHAICLGSGFYLQDKVSQPLDSKLDLI